MVTLSELIETLQKLEDEGHGDLNIYAVSGSSGVAYELSNAFIRGPEHVGDAGPFDEDGDWIEIYAGN